MSSSSSPGAGRGRGRGRGRPPGSGRGGTRTIVIDSNASKAPMKRVNTGSLVIQPVKGQGVSEEFKSAVLNNCAVGRVV